MAIQLAVLADDNLDNDDVLLYFVRQNSQGISDAKPIRLDEQARFLREDKANWDYTTFDEEIELKRQLLRTRRSLS